MNTREILDRFANQAAAVGLSAFLENNKKGVIALGGLSGSAPAFALALVAGQYPLLAICEDEESAAFMKNDLDALLGDEASHLLRTSFKKPLQTETEDNGISQERASLLYDLTRGKPPHIIVSYPAALAEKTADSVSLDKSRFDLNSGEALDLDFLIEMLNEYHFSREDFVYEPGQYSIRGGIIDIYSFSNELPYRFELDGRTIESIRIFDPMTQLSLKEARFAAIVPNVQNKQVGGKRQSFFEYFSKEMAVALLNAERAIPTYQDLFEKTLTKAENPEIIQEIFETGDELLTHVKGHRVIEISGHPVLKPKELLMFNTVPQPSFNRQFNLIMEHLDANTKINGVNLIFSETSKQIERLYTIFEDLKHEVNFEPVYRGLSAGFMDRTLNMAVYTEHELFGRHFQYRSKTRYTKNQAITLKELNDLQPGDFIVHVDHGIGKFQGLQKIEMGGRKQEAVRILYKNDDLLYVNISSLHKISKYTGKEGTEPKLNKLGSDAWQNLKNKTKKQVKDIARDLIKLYAKRKAQPGFQFSPDSYLQLELEASFFYEDTPDQSKSTEDVKNDMERPHPMDRLICGDVGFGKTEVAIRAAFKAVTDSKQVAILVPTTILAQQHYRTFKSRLEGFPCTVDYINRFRSAKQQKQTLKNLKEGKVDIIIGTHRLLGKDVEFNNLGLLIIDEEQKFGVASKERLKAFKVNVDTLTLTATPIPRTLHFSLMGARDLSIINTPPQNRQPVKTELHVFDKDMLKNAIDYELKRGGQVFVVHNRVKDIAALAGDIRSVCPDARVAIAHGQMHGDELENVMIGFVEGEYDVLVATTIIESGLDIPNANTIIINNAHYFGLSDLHQMRGRVGRSNKKAYCYLFCPSLHTLSEDARRRLIAIEEFSELGSGFNVAMRDLDIRGAGNLLGGEQSGFIAEIGFDMYHKILDEAIEELKLEEFKEVFTDDQTYKKQRECLLETDLDAMIPDEFVRNISERLSLYSELARLKTPEQLVEFKIGLRDRFGPLPRQVERLLDSVKLKWMGEQTGFEKINFKNNKLAGTFITDDAFFKSETFSHIIQVIQQHPRSYALKQNRHQLMLICEGVEDVKEAINRLVRLGNPEGAMKILENQSTDVQ